MNILITGAAGFIGFHLSKRLLAQGHSVVGVDNMNDYYDVSIKNARLNQLQAFPKFSFRFFNLMDQSKLMELFGESSFDRVVNLAAQAGVRHSLEHPRDYIDSNIVGFLNILEACRHHSSAHLVYASSSSVYGLNGNTPFSTHNSVDHPVSLYAASKKSNEMMAHSYSHLFGVPTTGLRFFTVYGPWGRPDMALFRFTKSIIEGKPIDVYNYGKMSRDFTYVEDIVEGIVRVMNNIPKEDAEWDNHAADSASSSAPYRIYNIGNGNPVRLLDFITELETALGKKAIKNFLPLQPGDVPSTAADISDLIHDVGFKPKTSVREGIGHFVDWYLSYFEDKPAREKQPAKVLSLQRGENDLRKCG